MKSLRCIVLLAAIIAALPSCASRRQNTEQWVGRSEADLIAELGAPDRETSDGRGGHILVYERISSYTTAGMAAPNTIGGVTMFPGQTYNRKRSRQFFVDPKGIIYSARLVR